MDRQPDKVRQAGERLQLGSPRKRYRFWPAAPVWLLPFPLIVTVIALCAGGTPILIAFGSVTVLLVAWAVLIRLNRSVYVFDEGLVSVNLVRRVRHAWRWSGISQVHGVSVRVEQTIGSFDRRDYAFIPVAGDSLEITTLAMPKVAELAAYVARRVRDSRVARLAAGETVPFGVFEVSPSTLRHTPRKLADRPSVPVTAPWSQVKGVGVDAEGLLLTVVLADGRRLTDLVADVADLELFVATVSAITQSSL